MRYPGHQFVYVAVHATRKDMTDTQDIKVSTS
jgi:hypothetical protein